MELDELEASYPAINGAANALLSFLGPSFTGTPAGHIETDIAAAASVAGSTLLRDAVPDCDKHPPGVPILADVHDGQAALLAFMAMVSPGLGLSDLVPHDFPVTAEHRPRLSVSELVGKLQEPLRQVTSGANLALKFQGHVGTLAAMKLVAAGTSMNLIDEAVGKALAAYYLVAGSKTVPPPFDQGPA